MGEVRKGAFIVLEALRFTIYSQAITILCEPSFTAQTY
jgi:hypothetical protein